MIVATVQQNIAIVVGLVVVAGWILYLVGNARRAKPEVGSEIELAPNRKPYLDDEQLEGPKLERALTWGLVSLTIVGVGLPLYWLNEPDRMAGAIDNYEERAASEASMHGQPIGGGALFATTEEGGFNCAGCHGGMQASGGVAPYTITKPKLDDDGTPVLDKDGEPETTLDQVEWKAPALNTVLLRYSEEEVRYILTYGRPFSPMPAWGAEGGGPLNEQQLDNLIRYLKTIQLTPEEAQKQAKEEYGETDGAALFDAFCARCHTLGWSYDEPAKQGSGAFGPNLTGGATTQQFPLPADHIEFITQGAEDGQQYGVQGQSREGMMPGFGQMLTKKQIKAIVEYERGL
jgi:mono/diheme cytochrome c family protein